MSVESDKLVFVYKQLERCYDEYFGDADEEMELAFEYIREVIDNIEKEKE